MSCSPPHLYGVPDDEVGAGGHGEPVPVHDLGGHPLAVKEGAYTPSPRHAETNQGCTAKFSFDQLLINLVNWKRLFCESDPIEREEFVIVTSR